MTFRLRDLPAYPILALLHLLFTVSSLCVRFGESIVARRPAARAVRPPRHIALVLSKPAGSRAVDASRRKGDRAGERRAVVESIKRVVDWADSEGVDELSVWDSHGEEASRLEECRR